MHIKEQFENYLDNKKYIIMLEDSIYLYGIRDFFDYDENQLVVMFNNKKVVFKGNKIRIKKYSDIELLLNGEINEISWQ